MSADTPVRPRATVVLATRLDPPSAAAARVAARLARGFGEDLVLVYVAEELETVPTVSASAGLDEESVRQEILAEAEQRMREFARAHLGELQPVLRIGEGDVVPAILETARKEDADFLVVGTESRSTLMHLVLGDITRSILQRAPCPVVVVPPEPGAGGTIVASNNEGT